MTPEILTTKDSTEDLMVPPEEPVAETAPVDTAPAPETTETE